MKTSAVPSQPTKLKMRFTITITYPQKRRATQNPQKRIAQRALRFLRCLSSTAPPFAVDRLGRQEQTKRNEAQVVDHVRGVDHALPEVVEVVDDRQIRRELVHRRTR